MEKLTHRTKRIAGTPSPEKREVQYYFVGPDNEIYQNRENYPPETLAGFSAFKGVGWIPFRFAYDSRSGEMFVQDDNWRDLIEESDEGAWALFNGALAFVGEEFGVNQVGRRYGEPPDTAELRKLSQYGVAWKYISKYVASEFGVPAKDIPVVEFVPEVKEAQEGEEQPPVTDEGVPVAFSQDGTKKGDVSVSGPVLLVDRTSSKGDYGIVNQGLIASYLQNLDPITSSAIDPFSKLGLMARWVEGLLPGGFEQYYAIWGEDGTQVYRMNEEQKNRLFDEDAVRNDPSLKGYDGPILLLSYIPVRNQVVFQNFRPDDAVGMEKQMLEDVKKVIASNKQVPIEDLSVGFDDTKGVPLPVSIKKFTVVWDYITDVLAPRAGFEPKDITVIEMPLSQGGGTKAAFVRGEKEEESLVPGAKDYRLSYGITIPYPFILLESRIRNLGEKYYALLHEYTHFSQELRKLPMFNYSFEGGVGSARDSKERLRRFVEYINNPNESEAHLNQMVYMLHMGIPPAQVIDMFMPVSQVRLDPNFVIHRAEYRKLLDKAMEIFRKDMGGHKGIGEAGPPTKAPVPMDKEAALDLSINNWWFQGSQENANRSRHLNTRQEDPPSVPGTRPGTAPYNMRRKKNPALALTVEGLLSKSHDEELSCEKTTEQLLRESYI